ncbi:hypothetical protein [Rhodococcus opacus]|uniref:hypothetical protein n=1 Tax=Rhodococcus opacus TaxID=37919 RepID=UPI002236A4B3|nr:hypothetical protein [Rhodococcus opacus]UZG59896.1 hypothetical protein ONE62_39895 [Rhodococcus opacus]
MPRPSSWVNTTASTLGEELARIGLTVPTDRLEALLTDRVAAVAEQMRITERTARRYFDHDTLRTLARELALSIKDEAPGADLLTLPRTIAMPLPTLGATIAALVEAAALTDTGPHEPAPAMALICTLGVLTETTTVTSPTSGCRSRSSCERRGSSRTPPTSYTTAAHYHQTSPRTSDPTCRRPCATTPPGSGR